MTVLAAVDRGLQRITVSSTLSYPGKTAKTTTQTVMVVKRASS